MIYLLYESSLGFLIFKLNQLDKVALKDPKILKQLNDFQSLKKYLSLEGSHFFHGHNVATETIHQLQKNEVPEVLLELIKTSLPSKKGDKCKLAIQDKGLASVLNDQIKVKCVFGELYNELFRAIRNHLQKFLIKNDEENITQSKITQTNLGLGHALARNNIKFDKKKQDKAIINSFALLEQMEKNLNTFCMRIKEGYSWHFPELAKIVPDNETYTKLVYLIGNKNNLAQIDPKQITEIVGSEDITHQVLERYKTSVGNDMEGIDEQQIKNFADYTIKHFQFKKDIQSYLRDQMEKIAPNLTKLLGESIGARLLSHAGGLKNLAMLPSSTIQILGAEKALFRAIRKKGDTPKYGLLFNSSYIQKAKLNAKGKVSRMLANKCGISARLDYFTLKPSCEFGEHFKVQLEEKVVNPNNNELGKKNIEDMENLVQELTDKGEYLDNKNKD